MANGDAVILPGLPGSVQMGNPDVIALLAHALNEARAGRLIAVGLIQVAGPHAVGTAIAGPAMMEVYTGAGMIQTTAMQAMTRKQSPIVRPAMQA